jgi:hypothetical protein
MAAEERSDESDGTVMGEVIAALGSVQRILDRVVVALESEKLNGPSLLPPAPLTVIQGGRSD